MSDLRGSIERQWYGRPSWLLLLAPLVPVFMFISAARRALHRRTAEPFAVPVVVVGNITVGGTGKSPTIIALVHALRRAGYTPGVITRGYGAGTDDCRAVPRGADASSYGDEPVMIAAAADCPVVVGVERAKSAAYLIEQFHCDIVLSDDGLQHYKLHRTVELAVVDGQRQLGNGWRLPVGPLRESARRLQIVDFVLINGGRQPNLAPPDRTFCFSLKPVAWLNLRSGARVPLQALPLDDAVAIAGIGNPQRFFDTLKMLGFDGECRSFADHYPFRPNDLRPWADKVLLMTEKDAVKCRSFAADNWWALSVEADLPKSFLTRLMQSLTP